MKLAVSVTFMFLLLVSAVFADPSRKELSKVIQKEVMRMYFMQQVLGDQAPLAMMMGSKANLFNDDTNSDENMDGKDVSKVVRKELTRMFMLQQMFEKNGAFAGGNSGMNPLMMMMLMNGGMDMNTMNALMNAANGKIDLKGSNGKLLKARNDYDDSEYEYDEYDYDNGEYYYE